MLLWIATADLSAAAIQEVMGRLAAAGLPRAYALAMTETAGTCAQREKVVEVECALQNGGEDGRRPVRPALLRGLRHSCPACGARTLYSSYLRIADRCSVCGEPLMHHRADDAPPYFTILIAGHIIIPLLMMTELTFTPPLWLHLLIWVPATAILSLVLLPRIKGAIVGLQWAQRMHAFEQDGGTDLNPGG